MTRPPHLALLALACASLFAFASILLWRHYIVTPAVTPAFASSTSTAVASEPTPDQSNVQQPEQPLPTRAQNASEPSHKHTHEHEHEHEHPNDAAPERLVSKDAPLNHAQLRDLLQRKLSPAMRRDINQHLQPNGKPAVSTQGPYGSYLDFSDRALSVVVAVIDDDGSTVVTDVMQALPVSAPK